MVTLGDEISPLMGPREKWESPIKKKKKKNLFRETRPFHSVTTQTQAVVTISTTTASYFSYLKAKVCVI